jgi:hypothetical protein
LSVDPTPARTPAAFRSARYGGFLRTRTLPLSAIMAGKFGVDHIAVLRVALGGPYGGLGRLPALAAMPGCPRPLLSQICARRQDLGIPQCKRPTTLTSGAIRRPPTTWRRVRHREPRHRAGDPAGSMPIWPDGADQHLRHAGRHPDGVRPLLLVCLPATG